MDQQAINHLRQTPFVFIAIALVTGILATTFLGTTALWLLCPSVPVLLYLCLRQRRSPALAGFLVGGIAFAGAVLTQVSTLPSGTDVSQLAGQTLDLELCALDNARKGKYRNRLIAASLPEHNGALTGKLLLQLPRALPPVRAYDRISCKLRVEALKGGNTGYAGWLRRQGVHATGRVEQLTVTGHATGLQASMAGLRDAIADKLKGAAAEPATAGLAVAMLLGDRSGLAPEIRADFSAAGLSHVLAISGLHVGMIFLFLNVLLGFLLRFAHGEWWRAVLVSLLLVAYMLLTGCSPAVSRAVLMLIILQFGRTAFRNGNTLNFLSASAVILLLVDPLLLFDVGFQLSYAAVTAIVLLTPRISAYLERRLPVLPAHIRRAAATCLAAQLGTSPLIWLYFGELPTYFLVSNLLLLPFIAFNIYLGFATVMLCWIPGLGDLLGGLLDTGLAIVVACSAWLAALPGATFASFKLSDPGFRIFFCLLVGGLALIHRREWHQPKYRPVVAAIGLFILFSAF